MVGLKKTLILLAGYPATGKTYMKNMITSNIDNVQTISPDEIKLKLWKKHGFRSLEEKEILVDKSWVIYYETLELLMKTSEIVLSEYPFSDKQRSKLEALTSKYGFNIITIRLVAEFETLYQRHYERDILQKRDIVYNVSEYDPDNIPQSTEHADDIVDKQGFRKRYDTRGYGTFSMGYTIEVDTTDFSKVNYGGIVEEIKNLIA